MPKPLSEKQREILVKALDKPRMKALAWGRGCKQTMNGLAERGLIDRIYISFQGGSSYYGYLTDEGRKVAEELQHVGLVGWDRDG